ncbi:MAG: hypothetical protein ACI8PT_000441 [Gammaproteobacteria bacterium]|jgi:hypothetical protein
MSTQNPARDLLTSAANEPNTTRITGLFDLAGSVRNVIGKLFGAEIANYKARRGLKALNTNTLRDIGL